MNYKVKGAVRRSRKYFIWYAIIWLIIAIFLCPAITYSYAVITRVDASGGNALGYALEKFSTNVINPAAGFDCVFRYGIFGEYIGTVLCATLIYSIFFFIGFVKAAPKNEYTDIEHGSGDFSQHGEQYKMLSKNKGMILAQDNYLPVDRRGNINVLIVGRIWYW